jgi:hypothetical protein
MPTMTAASFVAAIIVAASPAFEVAKGSRNSETSYVPAVMAAAGEPA